MTTSETRPTQGASEVRDGMRIDWDVLIEMDDGDVLRADVFRPVDEAPAPVLMSYGPYGKGLRFAEHHPEQWDRLIADHPDVAQGSSGKYQAWEVADPEKWVPHGYALVRVDSRGAGRSPGFVDPHSPREILDTYYCVEWAGTQPWSTGKVGMLGISYYATNAWLVASLETPPPHLAAVCPWEGSADYYRDVARHGGVLTTWARNWWSSRVLSVQHGFGDRGSRSPNNGELVAGPETLTDAGLAANRADVFGDQKRHVFDDEWTRGRSAIWDHLKVPVLSAANWGSAALHLRGNIEGFVRAASEQKWLEVHGLEHWTHFYTDYGIDLQRRFFDCFLMDDDAGWVDQPRVMLNVRRPGEVFDLRGEDDWPIPDTRWTRMYLAPDDLELATSPPSGSATISFAALGGGLRFLTPPMDEEVEFTGPVAAKLSVSSTTSDADLFLVLHVFDRAGDEVTFQGAMDPMTSVGKGWLRASHRKLDPDLTREHRPYHPHDASEELTPGEVYELDVEIWPTSIVVPPGHRIGLSVLGRDYIQGRHDPTAKADFFAQSDVRYGSGPFVHDDHDDRPNDVFAGTTTIHVGGEHESYLLLPVIPPRSAR